MPCFFCKSAIDLPIKANSPTKACHNTQRVFHANQDGAQISVSETPLLFLFPWSELLTCSYTAV